MSRVKSKNKMQLHKCHVLLLGAYPLHDVAVQLSLRNRCLFFATLLLVVMYFSHFRLGFPLRLVPANIPCIIVHCVDVFDAKQYYTASVINILCLSSFD